ncbi:TPA: hypothetical protein QDB36_003491 [Burkholderia multivorans]|nr:hypothetical protein [Burkholderia multivorans]HDR9299527.1 hypothetical protein [Burkholderia multivorans]HDR9305260.1 hypothetical protein [Burkholderia multivorans]HDR9311266.1 hypothetical protein [Burkholderia multivorans]HDR9363902.1 hypothetical protein [Burkholderia multivorans]
MIAPQRRDEHQLEIVEVRDHRGLLVDRAVEQRHVEVAAGHGLHERYTLVRLLGRVRHNLIDSGGDRVPSATSAC